MKKLDQILNRAMNELNKAAGKPVSPDVVQTLISAIEQAYRCAKQDAVHLAQVEVRRAKASANPQAERLATRLRESMKGIGSGRATTALRSAILNPVAVKLWKEWEDTEDFETPEANRPGKLTKVPQN